MKIFQNKKNRRVNSLGILRPDCSALDAAEFSDDPQDWLFHPTGITFHFDAKKCIHSDSDTDSDTKSIPFGSDSDFDTDSDTCTDSDESRNLV